MSDPDAVPPTPTPENLARPTLAKTKGIAMYCPKCARKLFFAEKRCPICQADLIPYYNEQKQGCAAMLGGCVGFLLMIFILVKFQVLPGGMLVPSLGGIVGAATGYLVAGAMLRLPK